MAVPMEAFGQLSISALVPQLYCLEKLKAKIRLRAIDRPDIILVIAINNYMAQLLAEVLIGSQLANAL
jgi:hypothetical protein